MTGLDGCGLVPWPQHGIITCSCCTYGVHANVAIWGACLSHLGSSPCRVEAGVIRAGICCEFSTGTPPCPSVDVTQHSPSALAHWHTGTRTTAPTCAHLHVRTSTATFSRGPLLHQDVGPLLLFLSSCACFDSPPSLCNLGWENGLASTLLLPLCVFSRLAIASSPFSSSFENRRSPFFFFF